VGGVPVAWHFFCNYICAHLFTCFAYLMRT